MNYDEMEAGREVDALVAEKVMGLIPQKDFGEWPEHEWKRYEDGEIDRVEMGDYHMGPQCTRCYYCYCDDCGKGEEGPCERKPKPYSTNISFAWEVVEKMISNGFTFAIDFNDYEAHAGQAPLTDMWYCSFVIPDGTCEEDWADTAPLAISRCASKAMEEKEGGK